MIKGFTVFIFCLLGIPATLFSQELSLQVIVPLAGLASEKSISYSQTVGETAIEIIDALVSYLRRVFSSQGL